MRLYDVHTHGKASATDIKNVIFSWDDPVSKGYYSIGAHPLFYEWTRDLYAQLEKLCRPKSMVAVGECGFDKRSPMSFSEQSDLFLTHVRISEELEKPLMVHCVGCFNELAVVRRDTAPKQPWIVHGFRKNPQLAESLVQQGFYFSLGKDGVRREGLLDVIPLDRLFFETDEDTELTIQSVYREAAAVLGVDPEFLAGRVEENFKAVFLNER